MSDERCKYCGSGEYRIYITASVSPHYAAVVCGDCRRHQRWVSKPESKRIRRPLPHRNLVRRYSQGYCELCLTEEKELPGGQILEGHHVIEYAKGGSDDRTNVWIVCTRCARLIHWLRKWCT